MDNVTELRERIAHLERKDLESRRTMAELLEDGGRWRKYEFIANTALEFMTLINRDYVYEFVNDAYCNAHQKDRGDFLGRTVARVWGEDVFRDIIRAYLDRCFSGEIVRYESWFEYPGQGLRCYAVSFYPYFQDHTRVTHAVMVSHDVTESKETEQALRESERKYRNIFEDAIEGIFLTSPDGRLLSVNPALARMIGYGSPEEAIEGITDLGTQVYVNPEDRVRLVDMLEREETVKGFETQHFRTDRSILWVSINARAVKDPAGRVLRYEGTIEDITAQKEAQDALCRTMDKLRKSLAGTIQAMSLVVETRDPYTAGHQRRVASLASAIARELGLSPDRIDNIRMAGSIHDIGKLAVPADLLSKPTKLMDIEFSLIKFHSQAGYTILKDAELPCPIAQAVFQHHERLDGKGYPQGLKGEEILLEARILTIADVVEAISSHRPYRPALGVDAALEEIEKNKGIAYDEQVVDACVRLFREKDFRLD